MQWRARRRAQKHLQAPDETSFLGIEQPHLGIESGSLDTRLAGIQQRAFALGGHLFKECRQFVGQCLLLIEQCPALPQHQNFHHHLTGVGDQPALHLLDLGLRALDLGQADFLLQAKPVGDRETLRKAELRLPFAEARIVLHGIFQFRVGVPPGFH